MQMLSWLMMWHDCWQVAGHQLCKELVTCGQPGQQAHALSGHVGTDEDTGLGRGVARFNTSVLCGVRSAGKRGLCFFGGCIYWQGLGVCD